MSPLRAKPPPRNAVRLDRLLYLRRNYLFNLTLIVPVLILLLVVFGTTVAAIFAVVCFVVPLTGMAMLERQIRRERRRPPAAPGS